MCPLLGGAGRRLCAPFKKWALCGSDEHASKVSATRAARMRRCMVLQSAAWQWQLCVHAEVYHFCRLPPAGQHNLEQATSMPAMDLAAALLGTACSINVLVC